MNGFLVLLICITSTALSLLILQFLTKFIINRTIKKIKRKTKNLEDEIERQEKVLSVVQEIIGEKTEVVIDHDNKQIYIVERVKDEVDNSTNW